MTLIAITAGLQFGVLAAGVAALLVGVIAAASGRSVRADNGTAGSRLHRALRLVNRYPVHAAAIALMMLSAAGAVRTQAATRALAEAQSKLRHAEVDRDTAARARDENAAHATRAQAAADAAIAEMKTFTSVIEPERARRQAAEEEKRKREEAEAAAKKADDARRAEEERARAARAKRGEEIAAIRKAIQTGRQELDRAAEKFEAVAFDHSPGSLTWITSFAQNVSTAGLCANLMNEDLSDACRPHFVDFYQATQELKDAYLDFFRGGVPVGWVAQKDTKARAVLDDWSRDAERLN